MEIKLPVVYAEMPPHGGETKVVLRRKTGGSMSRSVLSTSMMDQSGIQAPIVPSVVTPAPVYVQPAPAQPQPQPQPVVVQPQPVVTQPQPTRPAVSFNPAPMYTSVQQPAAVQAPPTAPVLLDPTAAATGPALPVLHVPKPPPVSSGPAAGHAAPSGGVTLQPIHIVLLIVIAFLLGRLSIRFM